MINSTTFISLENKQYSWPPCEADVEHNPKKLIVTQIIPKNGKIDLVN